MSKNKAPKRPKYNPPLAWNPLTRGIVVSA
jgi:hypothetical protein